MKLINSDCLWAMKAFPDNSIDSLITDPPAGISFMGKDWDKDKGGRDQWIKWFSEIMSECLRVLKPGAHGFVWAIPRTSHWTATALENAGFEIRDIVTHLFGSGFPKSHNISKAIEKKLGVEREVIGEKKRHNGKSSGKMKLMSGGAYNTNQNLTSDYVMETKPASNQAKQWDGYGTALKPSNERWILCKKPEKMDMSKLQGMDKIILNIEKSWKNILEGLYQKKNMFTISTVKEMIIELKTLKLLILENIHQCTIQEKTKLNGLQLNVKNVEMNLKNLLESIDDLSIIIVQNNVTKIADILPKLTEKYQREENEIKMVPFANDIILIRKPLSEKSIVDNVLKHSTGAINIDVSRVETQGEDKEKHLKEWDRLQSKSAEEGRNSMNGGLNTIDLNNYKKDGRFPANLILDEKAGEMLGEVSRFFYCAKASKKDRGEGNIHPTCKNTKLMQYLIKMVSPPNSTVLDPFMGSGSTGVACKQLGFNFIGIEKEKEYYDIACKRIERFEHRIDKRFNDFETFLSNNR